MKTWELFSHMADIGIRGMGSTEAEAFEMGAVALTAVISDPSAVRKTEKLHITCRAHDLEYLFYDWINSLIYEMDVRKMLFGSFDLIISADGELGLEADVYGEAADRERHHPAVLVKGATLTELCVKKQNGQWVAQCIVDV
jgi:SHS2 domain-containing protein